ncbi:MAG: integration host factor [Coriobacteriia bacterium]|nr:integration host factor [Coriobacteriia bacterium]MCL2537532.1 integration host factor [Coriobacteriia bacterium]
MALPKLSDEQRKEYLEKAAAARRARADLRRDLKEGKVSFIEVMNRADDPVVARMKVVTLLESLPGYGKARAQSVLTEIGIAETRKVQGLGSRQRTELIELLS